MSFVDNALAILDKKGTTKQNLQMLEKCRAQLVPFVGAGLSADFGFPAWHTLLGDLADRAELAADVAPLLANNQFEEAAEAIVKVLPNAFNDAIRDTFDKTLLRPLTQGAVAQVPKVAQGLVITTNLDRVLEAAFEDAGVRFSDVFPGTKIQEAVRAVQLNQHCLLKLHGDYRDSSSWILALSQYADAYGHPEPDRVTDTLPLPKILGQALAAHPLLFLGCSLKTDRTTTVINTLAERYKGLLHFALLSSEESTLERLAQLDRWNIRPLFFPKGDFQKVEEFLRCLADRTTVPAVGSPTADPRPTPAFRPSPTKAAAQTHINGYKLYYFRRMQKLGIKSLARLAGVDERTVVRVEKVREGMPVLGVHCFQRCRHAVLSKLEAALQCPDTLEAGQADDFLTEYTSFYRAYRGTGHGAGRVEDETTVDFETKAIVFDFDGTLTVRTDARTTWEKIWLKLGYSIDDCAQLHALYSAGRITHQQWCDLTRDRFRERGFRQAQLEEIAKSIMLMDGTIETLSELRQRHIRLYVTSGSIKQIIAQVLGTHWEWFEELHANDMLFDASGLISEIRGTRFDFEGKATFIRRIIGEYQYKATDVLFVGNSCNDVFAIQSGARTLCINARATDQFNKQHWTYFIPRVDNLSQILKHVSL